jgi:hypothetical protein
MSWTDHREPVRHAASRMALIASKVSKTLRDHVVHSVTPTSLGSVAMSATVVAKSYKTVRLRLLDGLTIDMWLACSMQNLCHLRGLMQRYVDQGY